MMDDDDGRKRMKNVVFFPVQISSIMHGVLGGCWVGAGSHFCPKNSHKRRVSLSLSSLN